MKKGNYKGLFFTVTNMLKAIPNKVIEKAYDLNVCIGVTTWGGLVLR
jgi:hypothetical protein